MSSHRNVFIQQHYPHSNNLSAASFSADKQTLQHVVVRLHTGGKIRTKESYQGHRLNSPVVYHKICQCGGVQMQCNVKKCTLFMFLNVFLFKRHTFTEKNEESTNLFLLIEIFFVEFRSF